MKRIFTAIDIPDEARRKVFDYIETLRGEFPHLRAGWERAEKLHLTLKFLGDTDENQLAKLNEAVAAVAEQISDFSLRISKTGAFSSKRNARILWLGVYDEASNLHHLNEILECECERRGFAKEARNFKPHLTIARLREPHKARELIERHLQNNFQSDEFKASEIVIYESRLQKSGLVYQIVSRYKLEKKSAAD